MINEPLMFIATSDLAGKLRGKAFAASELEDRLERGVGWTPTNSQITCFDRIARTPFGPFGDLVLLPDPQSAVNVDFGDARPPERLILGDLVTPDGARWPFCPRGLLKTALSRLESVAGANLVAAFEHEFQITGDGHAVFEAYGLGGFREHRVLAETIVAGLRQAGLKPDTILHEYGQAQFEVTIDPERGVRAADAAVIVREVVRASALRNGQRATFTPIRDLASVGNGVHIHLSLVDRRGAPILHDAAHPHGLSTLAGSFAAGILDHLPSILAITAPSAISYRRLTPHRWSAAFNNLGFRDREAALRICPGSSSERSARARQFNLEYRAADAAASPFLALAAVLHAGCQGIEDKRPMPDVTEEDLALLSAQALKKRGIARLPQSLEEALERLVADKTVAGWFGEPFIALYADHKRGELEHLDGMTPEAQCALYEKAY